MEKETGTLLNLKLQVSMVQFREFITDSSYDGQELILD